MGALKLKQVDFTALKSILYDETGIALSPEKGDLLVGRLQRRLLELGFQSFTEYADLLVNSHEERRTFVNLTTTNKTDFFREPSHFDVLTQKLLPAHLRAHADRPFMTWSAACSTGQEPYTLAIAMRDFQRGAPGLSFRILASDVDTEVLAIAEAGIYHDKATAGLSDAQVRQYFLGGTGANAGFVRVQDDLRRHIKFRQMNLMQPHPKLGSLMFDAIFLRNVLIYFDVASTKTAIENLLPYLRPGGHLFIGHSETVRDASTALEFIGDATYRKR